MNIDIDISVPALGSFNGVVVDILEKNFKHIYEEILRMYGLIKHFEQIDNQG